MSKLRIFAQGWSENRDGPGRRLVFYLKGCNMRCPWCANPESWNSQCEILFSASRADLAAAQACPHGAVTVTNCSDSQEEQSRFLLQRDICKKCVDKFCVNVWHHPAFTLAGQDISVVEIVSQAVAAKPLFGQDGGVTFGGGECSLQADVLVTVAQQLSLLGIHVAVETNASTRGFLDLVAAVNYIISDLKVASADKHRSYTGIDLATVVSNLRQAVTIAQQMVVRIPYIAGITGDDSEAFVSELRELIRLRQLSKLSELRIEVLAMHHLGSPKWRDLGREYPAQDWQLPSTTELESFIVKLHSNGINAVLSLA